MAPQISQYTIKSQFRQKYCHQFTPAAEKLTLFFITFKTGSFIIP